MLQNGYIESAEEEANKRTVLNRRTYSKPSGTQEKILSFQNGLLLETFQNKLSNIGITLEYIIISWLKGWVLEYHWYIIHLIIQLGILMVVFWNIMFNR